MSQKERPIEIAYRRLQRALRDESRTSARGPYRYAYTERELERKLRREACRPLAEDPSALYPSLERELLEQQVTDLLRGLGLATRQVEVCRLRFQGYTVAEIAERLGISQRRVHKLMADVRFALGEDLNSAELKLKPGEVPYYGWQETYLDAVRPSRPTGKR
ncbi:MAG: sigma factor-like helix-turn-helix DNA-binding protein [Armatimonadota bacterium]